MNNFNKHNLLITIQAVDLDDPLHGFFHEWLVKAAEVFGHITVLALRVGRMDLPANVKVIPLRPKESRSRFKVLKTLWQVSWLQRHNYDGVFVRGDPHYVLAAWWLWRILGKPIVFWFAHYKVSNLAVMASKFVDVVTASVKESCDHPAMHPMLIGQSINEQRFTFKPDQPRDQLKFLIYGRVSPVKKVEEVIKAFLTSGADQVGRLDIIGPAIDQDYAQKVKTLISKHPQVRWVSANVPYDEVPQVLQSYDVLINAYEASLDKAIVESLMCGLIVVMTTSGLNPILPTDLKWLITKTQEERVMAIQKIVKMSNQERRQLGQQLRQLMIHHHSLSSQINQLNDIFSKLLKKS